MPYKDPQKKKEWELKHRFERRDRRRELRRANNAVSKAARPDPEVKVAHNGTAFLLPFIVGGGALAAHNPKLAMGTGGLVLVVAALFGKGPGWWIAGAVLLVLGFFFYAVEEGSITKPSVKADPRQ
jgi:hypothetical protein